MSAAFEFFIAPFQYEFMLRGLLSALLVSVCGGLLGCILLLRRLALMGDALSHSLLPGLGVAYLLFGANPLGLFVGAMLAGLLTALGSALITRLTRIKEEAAFGSLFILFFGAGVALVSAIPTRINLMHFLFGNILGVSRADLGFAAGACLLTVGAFVVFFRSILLETFDPVFHRASGGRGTLTHLGVLTLIVISLVAALQAMGIVLALGLFLLPAVTAYLWCDRLRSMFLVAIGSALACSYAGILISYHFGLASGASIVLSLGTVFLASAIGSPKYGIAARLLRVAGEGRGIRHTAD